MDFQQFNENALKTSIYNHYEAEDITSLMCNYPKMLLRRNSKLYPQGRTTYRFKPLRNKITVTGQSTNTKKISELDQPELDEET